jgi:NAD(P)-dependent dehydrogenase (short-subunit alcohol dehydrogenase family)
MKLNEVRAIITGGASGLGHAVAQRLVSAGAKVTLLDVNEAAGQAAAKALGSSAFFSTVDVTDEAKVDAAVAKAKSDMGGLNLAVNCAGVATPRRLVNKEGAMPGDYFRKVVGINLVGTLLVAKSAAAAMGGNTPNEEGERGVIIMTASVAAFDGQIGQTSYTAAKAGVHGITLVAARDLASWQIRVNTIAPGIMDTPMLGRLRADIRDGLAASVPHPKRLGDPDDFARLAVEMLENPYLNGQTVRLDGAIRMAPR